jgi:hypothetical protein
MASTFELDLARFAEKASGLPLKFKLIRSCQDRGG